VEVLVVALLIEDHEEEVEAGHDRGRDVHVEAEGAGAVVTTVYGVGCRKD
jgi:hypothetical protein